MKYKNIKLFVALISFSTGFAQKPQTPTPSEIYFKMEQLNVLASALYIAAHPDDENTRLITYLTHNDKAYTQYLSLTRGNGGQNLISNELGTDLGIIRTHELWNARKIDGGKQFFSTADDFGYSKHPKEAFSKWDKDLLLQQMVYMIRTEQPDIIINRFDHRSEGTTHGHHTASAQLSKQAFELAANTSYQIENTKPYQTNRLFFNVSWFFFGSKAAFDKADKSKYIPLNIGKYYVDLGKNNQEIASLSRSQHQSQGFGDLSSRGEEIDYVELVNGPLLSSPNLFEGIDTTWHRIKGGDKIANLVTNLIADYDFKSPEKSLQQLIIIHNKINELPNSIWKKRKLIEVENLIKDCLGLFIDFTLEEEYALENTEIQPRLEIANRSNISITVNDIFANNQKTLLNKTIAGNDVLYDYVPLNVSTNNETSFKFISTFADFKQQFNQNTSNYVGLNILGCYIKFPITLQQRFKDPVKGEVYNRFHVIPDLSVKFAQPTYVGNSAGEQTIQAVIDYYGTKPIIGDLIVTNDNGKMVFTKNLSIDPLEKNHFVTIPIVNGQGNYHLKFQLENKIFNNELKWINYPHIPTSYYTKEAKTSIVTLDTKVLKKKNIGYIMGAGDAIPELLSNIGYQVQIIDLNNATLETLKQFETIIVGIRAFNTDDNLAIKNKMLFDYVKNGGVIITQYQTNTNLKTTNIAPFPITIGKTRITNENAPVTFINPSARVLNSPYKITKEHFTGWVQEQGLYYADSYDNAFTPILQSNDFEEPPTNGALLIANYGKGYYVYTGLSFFRQLPAGNKGALELFVNLIELK